MSKPETAETTEVTEAPFVFLFVATCCPRASRATAAAAASSAGTPRWRRWKGDAQKKPGRGPRRRSRRMRSREAAAAAAAAATTGAGEAPSPPPLLTLPPPPPLRVRLRARAVECLDLRPMRLTPSGANETSTTGGVTPGPAGPSRTSSSVSLASQPSALSADFERLGMGLDASGPLQLRRVHQLELVWWSRNSGSNLEMSAWAPVCPPGTAPLGTVVVPCFEAPAEALVALAAWAGGGGGSGGGNSAVIGGGGGCGGVPPRRLPRARAVPRAPQLNEHEGPAAHGAPREHERGGAFQQLDGSRRGRLLRGHQRRRAASRAPHLHVRRASQLPRHEVPAPSGGGGGRRLPRASAWHVPRASQLHGYEGSASHGTTREHDRAG
mmetsp:Transcript_35765/g.88031  ORF Transcript_35765/g.88031 Transcript_35765/m.88031 type:complete len:382 (+) Transcript_35765:38-1183(+)